MDYEDFERRHEERERRRRERLRHREERRRRRHHRERHGGPKERVLHTRISEALAEDIRKVAEELRLPVSNLVRNVLEEAFSAVENVSENVGALLEEVFEEADGALGRRRQGHPDREEAASSSPAAEPRERAAPADPAPGPGPGTAHRTWPEVVGWQPLLLNREGRCAGCGQGLARGRKAFVGVTRKGISETLLCPGCLGGDGELGDVGGGR